MHHKLMGPTSPLLWNEGIFVLGIYPKSTLLIIISHIHFKKIINVVTPTYLEQDFDDKYYYYSF